MPPVLADSQIIAQVLNGRVNLFEELIVRHQDQVAAIVAGKVPPDRVAEVAHDVFVRAFKSLRSFRGDSPFQHWLSSIAVRACRDFWRGQYRNQETPFSALSEEAQAWLESREGAASGGQGQDTTDRFETRELMDWALGQLKPVDRMVLTLTYFEDKSVGETAELMGISQANVKIKAMRARGKLRKIIGKALG